MTVAQSVAVILNPWANRGRAEAYADQIQWHLRATGFTPEIVRTTKPGDATSLARQFTEGAEYSAVVAAGGDGTINEVANGLFGSTIPMGFMPIGTGNDFTKMLDLPPDDLAAAAARLATAPIRAIDVGTANGRIFLNGVGIGIDARIAIESRRIKRLSGIAVYLIAMLKTIVRYRSPQMTVSYNDRTITDRYVMITVGNGCCHGGGFWITPQAKIDDGTFDVCLVDAMSMPAMLRHFPKVMRGTHGSLRQVTLDRTTSITIDAPEGVAVHLDGEILGPAERSIQIQMHPASLRIRA